MDSPVLIYNCDIFVTLITFVGINGPSYKQVDGLSGCLRQADSLCFDQVIVRVRRNASVNVETVTFPSTSRPLLSLPTNFSLEATSDQSAVSSRNNASLHRPANEQPLNSTLLPAKAIDNTTDILDILEASMKAMLSKFYHYCIAVCTVLSVTLLCQKSSVAI